MSNNGLNLTKPNSQFSLFFLALLAAAILFGDPTGFITRAADDKSGSRAMSEPDKSPKAEGPLKEDASPSVAGRPEVVQPAPLTPPSAVRFDFDGDGSADVSRWQVSSNEFLIRNSSNASQSEYGIGSYGARIAPGDYDGNGKTDIAVFKDGTFSYKPGPNPSASATPYTITLGTTGDIPVSADYDGDSNHTTDAAVYRPSTGTWYIRQSSTSNVVSMTWGLPGDIPVPGDYDGDGKSDIGIWRPSNGTWYIVGSSVGQFTNVWGVGATDMPIPGDFEGDGQTDIAVFRRTTGVWYIKYSSTGYASWQTQTWGNYGDQPVPADYDGDGKDDYAIWRPTTGVWWVVYSGNNYSIQTFTLGEANDRAVPAAYLKQVGGSVLTDELAASRLSPRNATGATNLYSQNFSWGRSLISLPGRAGHDLSLGIGYNSLIWTRSGDELYFDADRSNAGPGFRLGFPVIEPVYYDGTKQKFAYMMVTASGARVEFRQTTVSSIYETADSSYTQLKTAGADNPNDPVDPITITVTTTDGTQMTYDWEPMTDQFVCKRITDRNGNFLKIDYDSNGLLVKITDTLEREINITNTDGYPTSITQTWKTSNGLGPGTSVQTWATFSYITKPIATSFSSSVYNLGPPNDMSVKVLDKITYLDGSFTKFSYNGYAQVFEVKNHAPDSGSTEHILNSVLTDLATPSTNQSDSPRFTSTKTAAEKFNGGAPVEVKNEFTTGASYSLPGRSETGVTLVESWTVGHPKNLRTRAYFGSSGWREGLLLAAEDCLTTTSASCTDQKRWTWTEYEQDNASVSYVLNPRPKETRIGDGTNTKKTTIEYRTVGTSTVAEYGLVKKVEVGDLSNVLKRIETDYDLSQVYKDKRIIGLPSEVKITGKNDVSQNLELVSRVTYVYDGEDFTLESNQIPAVTTATHETTNYSSNFVAGRGNLTSTTRHDVTGQSAAVTSKIRYDIAGSVVARLDPLGRKTRVEYTDAFNDLQNRYSFAYPTKIYDPSNNYSEIRYRHDIGANVWARSPAPQGQSQGKITERTFDPKGRLEKDLIVNSGAYTRYEYPTNGIQSKVFSTIMDTNGNNTVEAADEVLTENWLDGAGRVRRTRTEHPSGSVGSWSAVVTEYDKLGRATRSTVPTEISVSDENDPESWVPAGDDDRGLDGEGHPVWLWKSQEYDWMDRVVREVNTDGTDRVTEYSTCGCAGGLITTVKSEVIEDSYFGSTPSTLGRRTVKSYTDLLGRTTKTEALLWNGDVYSTTVNEFNGRDQIVTTRQTDDTSTLTIKPFQEVVTTYDGHGRMKTRHYPVETTNTNTSWEYNADDAVQQVTDPRGVITSYTYNDPRGLRTGISYTVPQGSTIQATPSVGFAYDPDGNRTSMSVDNTATTTYAYDQLSRITSEVKTFAGVTGSFTIAYAYHLGGGLRSINDPGDSNRTISYGYNRAGSLESITKNGSSVLQDRKVRAFGEVKQEGYAGGLTLKQQFDPRLRISRYDVQNTSQQSQLRVDYSYNAAGQVDIANNITSANFDRDYSYDHMGRLLSNETKWTGGTNYAAYSTSAGYDVWNNLTHRTTTIWGYTTTASSIYQNNRSTSASEWNSYSGSQPQENWQYDASGNATQTGQQVHKFDAAGRKVESVDTPTPPAPGTYGRTELLIQQTYDGDGEIVKRFERETFTSGPQQSATKYDLRSTVLGGVVLSEIDQGTRGADVVYEPSGIKAGEMKAPFTGSTAGSETDPFGTAIPVTPPAQSPPQDWLVPGSYDGATNPFDGNGGCSFRGLPTDCSELAQYLSIGDPRTMNDTCPSCGRGMGVWLSPDQTVRLAHMRSAYGYDPFSWIGNASETRFQSLPLVFFNRTQRKTNVAPIIVPGAREQEIDTPSLLKALTFCTAEVFKKGKGWEATWIREMSGSQNGAITFRKGKQSFSVETGNDFTYAQITNIAFNRDRSAPVGHETAFGMTYRVGQPAIVTEYGRTVRTDPTTANYVGRDLTAFSRAFATDPPDAVFGFVLSTQIHELGHSLMARFLGRSDYLKSVGHGNAIPWDTWRKEIGWQFQKCVYDRYMTNLGN